MTPLLALALLTLQQPSPQLLTHSVDAYACFAPDGRSLVYQSNPGGNFDLYTIALDGSEPKLLVASPQDDITPQWSRDGKSLIFVSERDGNRDKLHEDDFDLYEMRADGSGVKRLTQGPEVDTYASWSPDGTRIAYAGGGPDEGNHFLFLVDPDGKNRVQLTQLAPGSKRSYDTQPCFSPDGKQLAFTRYEPSEDYERARICLLTLPRRKG